MRKVKLNGIILSAAMLAGLFTGCGKSGGETGSSKTSSNGSEAVSDKPVIEVSEEEISPKVTIEGTKFMVGGKELIINGANTPWDKWNDFGNSFDPDFWDKHFAELHEIGVNAVRVWVNCDVGCAIKLKPSGTVREVTEQHWTDVDKLFEIAEKHQIYLMPTLLSFDHFKNSSSAERWRSIITDETVMQGYIDSYVKPFAERYGDEPYLLGIDLINEPDWIKENHECGQLELNDLSRFFANCTAAIHEVSPDALVTVGIGMIKYNTDKGINCGVKNIISDEIMTSYAGEKACVDFYSPHYYDWMQKSGMGCAFRNSPEDYGLDGTKPAFLGEIGSSTPLKEIYEKCYELGWNGVMMWSSNNVGADASGYDDNWSNLKEAAESIAAIAPEKVFPLGKK